VVDDLSKVRVGPVRFPEWEPYPKPECENGVGDNHHQRVGIPGKTRTSITREGNADCLFYSGTWFADLVDNSDISEEARKTADGHCNKVIIASGMVKRRSHCP